MHRFVIAGLLLFLGWGRSVGPAVSQEPTSQGRSEVLVLGTYHFANPGLDIIQIEVADILSAEKQQEVAEVVEALARFRPTKIAVEVRREGEARLDSSYAAYRAGDLQLGRSEVHQIGFRLAGQFGHDRLYAIDHRGEFPFDQVMAYAVQHDQPFVARVQRVLDEIAEEQNRMHRENTLAEILRYGNDSARIAEGHSMYLEIGGIGAGDTYVGADLVSKWYERNIRIFTDIQRISDPGDRVLVIFGGGHAAILRELIRGDASMVLVEPSSFLP